MTGSMEGRVVALTGGSGGIGQAIARLLVSEGAQVAVGYRNRQDVAESLCRVLSEESGRAIPLRVDVTDEASIETFVSNTTSRLAQPDCLINCAGIASFQPTVELDQGTWDQVMNTNARGAFLCAKAVLPHMLLQETGDIVNVSSIAGSIGSFEGLAYASSKAALDQITRSLALEYGARGIRVNGVAPGRIDTPIRRTKSGIYFDEMLRYTPLRRLGLPDEVAAAVVFLASRSAPFITGETLTISGGLTSVWLQHVTPDSAPPSH
ncbi:SDR family NAD(P)-dependent oxidoreductase [Terrabacter sp. Ter38]|uniref:SDR family NAD(P)-dependent oxidoreductase n=1 Tax=Terrabacter sp. Ter38 TaxID=2926030 RepID=UPI0035B101D4